MAAFSYQNPLPNFLNLESSVNLLISTTNSVFADHYHLHPNINHITTNFFTTLHDDDHRHQQQQHTDNNNNIIINLDDHQANSNYSSSSAAVPNYNDINNNNNIHRKQSFDSSSVVLDHKLESGDDIEQHTDDDQKVLVTATAAVPPVILVEDKKRKSKNGSSLNSSAQYKDIREMNKWKRQKKSINCQEAKREKKKVSEEAPPVGYIHVRARRGQATDSHSLAERVRREKISGRMKLLQTIVPGCDKVTGKALMLDEIINYVQSLQNQVEFLSMKLASVNPLFYDFGVDIDSFMVKPADQNLSSFGGVLPAMENVQQCNTSNTFSIPNNYPLIIDSSSSSILFQQQAQIPNILSQNNGQLLWDVDDQRQKLLSLQ